MKDVFISYRRNPGEKIAKELYRYLDSKGLRVYFDKVDMQDGKPFPTQLETALKTTPNYVLIATQNVFAHGSEKRDWVWKEIELALQEYKKSPLERTITVLVPHGVVIPAWENLPEEIRDIADVQRIGERADAIDLPIGHGWKEEFERVFVAVTELNRRNLWYAAHRWLENSKCPGGRFASLHIEEAIMPNVSSDKHSTDFPINISFDEKDSSLEKQRPLLAALNETSGNLYLIGQGGIGKTTALMHIMNKAYTNREYTENAQIPIFVELSFAPDSEFGNVYEGGKSTFIRRSIFRQIRMDQSIKQVGSAEIDDLKDLFRLPYELAVKPISDLLNKEKPAPEYLLLLDGLNEVSIREIELKTSDGAGKIKTSVYRMIWREIEWIAENCPNVRIVLTSRSDESALDNFARLYLNELNDSLVIKYLKDKDFTPSQLEEVQKDYPLLETLRIPLFLTMYADLENRTGATTAGEILKLFFHERRRNIEIYTTKSRLHLINRNIRSSSADDLTDRFTPEMYNFILDFILPEIAWNMELSGEFYINKINIKKYILPVLLNRDDLSICGDYGQLAFADERVTDAAVHTKSVAQELLKISSDFSVVNETIINLCVNILGILQKTGNKYGFIHQHIRDYFAAIKNINIMRLSIYMLEEGEKELALECMNRVFKDEPVSVSVRKFIGEYLGEHKNKPYFADCRWNYGVPDNFCDRKIVDKSLNIFRGIFDNTNGYSIYNLIEILKDVREDLSGCDFRSLNFQNVSFNGICLGKPGLGACFFGAHIEKNSVFSYGHINKVYSVSFSPSGEKILSVSEDNSAILWDAKTGLLIEEFIESTYGLDVEEYGIRCGAFSPDGAKIAITMWSGEVDIRSSYDGKRMISYYSDYAGAARLSVFSPDSKRVATTYENETTVVRDVVTGTNGFVYDGRISNSGYNNSLNHSVFNFKNGTLITMANNDIYVWKNFDLVEFEMTVQLSIEKDKVWRQHESILYTLHGYKEAIFSPEGDLLVAISLDDKIRIFNSENGHLIKELETSECNINQVVFSHDSLKFASISSNGIIEVWDAQTFKLINALNINSLKIKDITFSLDGEMLLIASNTLAFWNIIKGEKLFEKDCSGGCASIAISPQNGDIATANKDGSIKILNQIDGTIKFNFFGHLNEISDVYFCKNHSKLIFSKINTINVWDYIKQKIILVLKQDDSIKKLASNQDETLLMTLSEKNVVRIWDFNGGNLIFRLSDYDDEIQQANVAPKGELLVTISKHGILRIWDIRNKKNIAVFKSNVNAAMQLMFAEDDSFIVIVGENGQIEKWDVKRENCVFSNNYTQGNKVISFDVCCYVSRALVSTENGQIVLIGLTDGLVIKTYREKNCIVSFDPNGDKFLLFNGLEIQLFNSQTGEFLRRIGYDLLFQDSSVFCGHNCYFTPTGNEIIIKGEGITFEGQTIVQSIIVDINNEIVNNDFRGILRILFNKDMNKIVLDDFYSGLTIGNLITENWPPRTQEMSDIPFPGEAYLEESIANWPPKFTLPIINNQVDISNVYGLNVVDANFYGSINNFSEEDKKTLRQYGALID